MRPAAHDLSIRQLEYVVAVADLLGFRRAAERLHVSQPTLSAQIQQVEHVLGVTIFERDKRRVLVTKAGAAVVARARRVLVAVDELIATSELERDPFAGVARIGVIPTVAPYLLAQITPPIAAAHPKLRLVFREEKTDDALALLRDGELDAVLLALVPGLEDLERETIIVDRFVVAAPKGHPITRTRARGGRVKLADLAAEPILLLDDGHCFRDQALELCARAGVREADLRATSLATLVQMVAAGAGVTLLPAISLDVENRRAQIEVRELDGTPPSRTIVLAWRRTSPLREVFLALAKTARRAAEAALAGEPRRPGLGSPRDAKTDGILGLHQGGGAPRAARRARADR